MKYSWRKSLPLLFIQMPVDLHIPGNRPVWKRLNQHLLNISIITVLTWKKFSRKYNPLEYCDVLKLRRHEYIFPFHFQHWNFDPHWKRNTRNSDQSVQRRGSCPGTSQQIQLGQCQVAWVKHTLSWSNCVGSLSAIWPLKDKHKSSYRVKKSTFTNIECFFWGGVRPHRMIMLLFNFFERGNTHFNSCLDLCRGCLSRLQGQPGVGKKDF